VNETGRDIATRKIAEMPIDRVFKLLIFMAGMEAERNIENKSKAVHPCEPQAKTA